jgi:2'-phosphotransferase
MILASSLDETEPDDATPDVLPSVQESVDPADYLIRANQGHSIKVDTEGLLKPITEEAGNVPETVIHGTDEFAWRLIIKGGGLRPMGRNHIHFASGLPAGFKPLVSSIGSTEEDDAAPVISGMRKNSSILIYIDIRAALAAGIKFHISENGVILTEGSADGLLPYEFFKRVESRKRNGGVIMRDGTLPEDVVVDVEEWKKEMSEASGKGKRGGRGVRGGRGGRGGGGDGRGGKPSVSDDSRDVMAGV